MATLKISDLSVGDWVRCGKWNGRIQRIAMHDGETVEVIIEADLGRLYMYKQIDEIDSIPITAEILEKNGFTRRSGELPIYEYTTLLGKMLRNTVVSLDRPDSYIVCRIEDTSKDVNDFGRIPVNIWNERIPIHIHDLQHALRLAGIDKEIYL